MSGAWIAGSVRATGMAIADPESLAAAVAASPDHASAVGVLRTLGWVRPGEVADAIDAAQHGVLSTLLWKLRVLAGWLPGEGVELVRSCVAWFEIANVEERLAFFTGASSSPLYELGRLGAVSKLLGETTGPIDIRHLLAGSTWGDPGTSDAAGIRWALRSRWYRWLRAAVPEAAGWADAAAALFVAREGLAQRGARASTSVWAAAPPSTWERFDATTTTAEGLWQAEWRWWDQVAEEAHSLLHRAVGTRERVVGCVGVLAVTAQRLTTALETVNRRSLPLGHGSR